MTTNNNDPLSHGDTDLLSVPKIISRRASDDESHNRRRSSILSQYSSDHSDDRSVSVSYRRSKNPRESAVNRMNNGVLASNNKSTKRISIDSLSASDSGLNELRTSIKSAEPSRSITSTHSNQNQQQQQQLYNELVPPTNNNESYDNNIQVDRNNGHEYNNNNGDNEQIQEQPFLTCCCNWWRYVLACCSPMKRYKKRSSAITMLENQYFIPPPEENTTFIESIIYAMNGHGQNFVVWIYQASFFSVLVISLFAYYTLVFSFAGVVVAMERASDGRCNFVSDAIMSSESAFEMAFELSWTTFTTVGYGQVAPSGEDCYPIRVGCSFFAFMGLLFNSLSAAIFFSKLERVLTKASVTFSSSICLQFDTVDADRGARVDSYRRMVSLRTVESKAAVPYPFLEFRIVNDHANYKSRAVRNASCAALVSLSGKHAEMISGEAQQSSEQTYKEFVTKSFDGLSRNRSMDETDFASPTSNTTNSPLVLSSSSRTAGKTKPSFFSVAKTVAITNALAASAKTKPTNVQDENGEPAPSGEEKTNALSENIDPVPKVPSARTKRQESRMTGLTDSIVQTAIIVQENDNNNDNNGQQATPEGRVFFPLELEPSTNPYMNRVWYLRHTLNAKSPLLKYSVREKLKRDGVWDEELTYQDILLSLVDFDKINVSFKGTSSASNSLLFTQKVCK